MKNEYSRKCILDCTSEAQDVLFEITNFFSAVAERNWLTPPEFFEPIDTSEIWDIVAGRGALDILNLLRLRGDWFRDQNDPKWGNISVACDWFNSMRTNHIDMFGLTAGSWHELVLRLPHRVVRSVWMKLGGPDRFGSAFKDWLTPDSNEWWIHQVSVEELQRAVQHLNFCGEWGGRPHHDSQRLWQRIGEEYARAITMLITIPEEEPIRSHLPPWANDNVASKRRSRFAGAVCPECGTRAYVESTQGATRYLKCGNSNCEHKFKKTDSGIENPKL